MYSPKQLGIQKLCANVSVVFDDIVENIEKFAVLINSSDSAVILTQSNAIVTIQDSSCKLMLCHLYYLTISKCMQYFCGD